MIFFPSFSLLFLPPLLPPFSSPHPLPFFFSVFIPISIQALLVSAWIYLGADFPYTITWVWSQPSKETSCFRIRTLFPVSSSFRKVLERSSVGLASFTWPSLNRSLWPRQRANHCAQLEARLTVWGPLWGHKNIFVLLCDGGGFFSPKSCWVDTEGKNARNSIYSS